ncbi:MAG: GAF domain-containing protein [Anaerolineaceae bacterium]
MRTSFNHFGNPPLNVQIHATLVEEEEEGIVQAVIRCKNDQLPSDSEIIENSTLANQPEQALTLMEERFNGIVQNTGDGILLIDENGVVVEWNNGLVSMTGIARFNAIGKYFWEVCPKLLSKAGKAISGEDLKTEFFEFLKHNREGNQNNLSEYAIQQTDGSNRIVQALSCTFPTSAGRLIYSMIRDITEKKQLEESTQRKAEELSVLHDLLSDISTIQDQPTLYKNIITYAVRLLNADGGCLYLYDAENQVVTPSTEFPYASDNSSLKSIEYGSGAVEWVVSNKKPLCIDRFSNSNFAIESTGWDKLRHAMLFMPMVWQKQLKGIIQVYVVDENRQFSDAEQELLSFFANQSAIAIENARLFEVEKSAHEQAELFRDVAQVVNESLELDEVLHRILGQLSRILTFATSSVLLFRETGKPALIAGIGYENERLTSRNASEVLIESPIIRKMAQDLKPVVIPDVRSYPDWIWVKGAEHVRSFMGVPIIAQQKLIGVLMVDSTTVDFFKESDLYKSNILAQQIAIAVQNARLFDAERTARERAEALRDAARIIGSSLSLNQVLQAVLDQLARVIIYDTGNIMLLEKDTLVIKAWRGYDYYCDPSIIDTVSFDCKLDNRATRTLNSRLPWVIKDVHNDPLWVTTAINSHVNSWLGVPIMVRDQVIGLLCLDRASFEGFTEDEVALAQVFAGHASSAIENARLYEAKEERAAELEALRQASLSLTSSLELQAVLDAILSSTLRLLKGANNGHIFLYSGEEEGKLTFGASLWSDGRSGEPIAIPRPDGLTATVARTGEMIVVHDMKESPIYKDAPPEWHGAIVGLPLKIGQRVVGVMNISYEKPRQFSDNDLRLLGMLGVQAAIAIENARLFEQAAVERKHLELLFDINNELAVTLDVDEILARAITLTNKVIKGVLGQAFLYRPDEDVLVLHSLCGTTPAILPEKHEKIMLHLGEGLAGWVAQQRQAVIVPDVDLDTHWLQVKGLDDNIHSVISAPILAEDSVLGVISVLHSGRDAFSDEQLELLQAICQGVGLALSNASRYQEIKRRLNEMTLIQSLAQKFNQRLDVQVVLDEVVNQLAMILGYPLVEIYLVEGEVMRLRAYFGEVPLTPDLSVTRGVVGKVIRTGKAILIPDVTTEPEYMADISSTVSELAVPIFRNDQVCGVINIETDCFGQLGEQDCNLLEVLAGQISIALENALLYERVREHAQELEVVVNQRTSELTELYQLSQKIGYTLSYDELFHILLSHLRSASGAEFAASCFFQNGNQKVTIETVKPLSPTALNQIRDNWVKVWLDEKSNQKDISHIPVEIICRDETPHGSGQIQYIESMMEAPILIGRRQVGILIVGGKGVQPGNEGQKQLLSTFAHQASLAVEKIAAILAAEQQRLANLVEHLPVGVLFLDSDFRLLVTNPLGTELLSALHALIRDGVLVEIGGFPIEDIIERHKDVGPVEIVQDEFLRRYFEVQARSVGEENHQWVIMLREVTEERENQTRIQMQERLATVGQLAAGIAHDFNNIMAAILVYADLLRNDRNIQEASQEKLIIIQEQVQRAASLIRQILDFSRRSIMEQSTLDLLPFIKELEKMLERILPETIHVELQYQSGNYLVNADPTRLQQVFMNLALNARDAMPEGGLLQFSLKHLTYQEGDHPNIPHLTSGNWVVISVKDSGRGIAPEHLPHIFEPFYTTKPVGQGTGLGLAQVYGIIKQHDGFIDVQSHLGSGTTFTIYLPVQDVDMDHSTISEPSSMDGVGIPVLIVEDDRATREALNTLLDAYNYKACTAANGLEALEYLEAHEGAVKIVISDIVMPKMGGLELFHAIQDRWPDIKMLFVTGHPMDGENQKLLEKGNVHWLQKPFSVQEFSHALQNLLES